MLPAGAGRVRCAAARCGRGRSTLLRVVARSARVGGVARLSELLAEDLGLTPDDVIAHIVHFYGREHGLTDAELIDIVRSDLDPWGIRSVPDALFGSSELQDPSVCRCRALGGLEHAPGPECPVPSRERRRP